MNPFVALVTFLFLWTSGHIAGAAFRLRLSDRLVRLAFETALGLSIWPILFLATTKLGIAWSAGAMRAGVYATIVAGLGLVGGRALGAGRRAQESAAPHRRSRRHFLAARLRPAMPLLLTFALLTVLAIAVRAGHIRGLAFPPWVDGVHHGMIVRLILEQGVVPAMADPYIPGAGFFYHWGFHVPAAFIAAATGHVRPSDIPTFLLHHGQMLNVLTLLMVYAAGRVLLRSREGGLFAATLATFVSYFPAFYLSWGRYTHLSGTLVLPPLLIALWKLSRTTRPVRWTIVTAILATGLLLIHVRIALFALTFAAVLLVATRPFVVRTLLRWGAAAILAGVLASPWLITLARNPHVGDVVTPSVSEGLPMHLVGSLHNRELLAIATAGVSGMAGWLNMPSGGRVLSGLWWLAIVLVSRYETKSPRARRRLPWPALALLGGWVLILAITLYWRPIGIDLTGLASLDSAIITMFLPLSLAGAALITWTLTRIAPRLRASSAFAIAALLAIGGALTVTDVVNPQTVFTEAEDLRALRWIETNAPADAVFAVDARRWMAPAWVGVDGGYWLGVATGRRTILPPLLYGWSLSRAEVERINGLLTAWSIENDFDALRKAGVTHIYIGARAKEEKRQLLLTSDRVQVLHRDGGAAVFVLRK